MRRGYREAMGGAVPGRVGGAQGFRRCPESAIGSRSVDQLRARTCVHVRIGVLVLVLVRVPRARAHARSRAAVADIKQIN